MLFLDILGIRNDTGRWPARKETGGENLTMVIFMILLILFSLLGIPFTAVR